MPNPGHQNRQLDTFMAEIKDRIEAVLPPEKNRAVYVGIVTEYLRRNHSLFRCERFSLADAIINAAMLGLEPGPPFELASILPYKDRDRGPVAKLVIEYRGYMIQAYRSGAVQSIEGRAVYKEDAFSYEFGRRPRLSHQPALIGNRGPLVHAYAIARMTDGDPAMEVITAHDANEARKDSPNSDHPRSLWNTREPQMWIKTAIKKLTNRLPRSAVVAKPGGHGPPPEYAELLHAVCISPELYQSALTILGIQKPTEFDQFAAILASMRDLYRAQSGEKKSNAPTDQDE